MKNIWHPLTRDELLAYSRIRKVLLANIRKSPTPVSVRLVRKWKKKP